MPRFRAMPILPLAFPPDAPCTAPFDVRVTLAAGQQATIGPIVAHRSDGLPSYIAARENPAVSDGALVCAKGSCEWVLESLPAAVDLATRRPARVDAWCSSAPDGWGSHWSSTGRPRRWVSGADAPMVPPWAHDEESDPYDVVAALPELPVPPDAPLRYTTVSGDPVWNAEFVRRLAMAPVAWSRWGSPMLCDFEVVRAASGDLDGDGLIDWSATVSWGVPLSGTCDGPWNGRFLTTLSMRASVVMSGRDEVLALVDTGPNEDESGRWREADAFVTLPDGRVGVAGDSSDDGCCICDPYGRWAGVVEARGVHVLVDTIHTEDPYCGNPPPPQ